jgi:simple sugar transport system permease protein
MLRQMVRVLRKRTEIGATAVTLLLIVGFAASTGGVWLSDANLHEVMRVTAILAIMSFGEALVVTTGEIDISVGSTFGVVGILYIALGTQIGTPLALLIALMAGALIGAINGLVVAYFKISSLVVTLGGLFVFRGLILAVTQSPNFYAPDAAMRADPLYRIFGSAQVLGYNNALVWALAVLLVVHYVLFWTPYGNRILAVGGSADSAHSRGVNVFFSKWSAYVICGFLAGLAAVLEASDLGYVDGSFGRQRELQVIAAAVLGGCALAGGRSSIIGTLLGAFILSAIQSYLVIRTIQPQWFILLLGLIVVLVSLADRGLTRLMIKLAK